MTFFVIIIGVNVVHIVVVNATTNKEEKYIIISPKLMFLNVRWQWQHTQVLNMVWVFC